MLDAKSGHRPVPIDNPAGVSLIEAFARACKMLGSVEVHATHRVTGAVQVFPLQQPFAFIGRAKPMGIRLDDPSVSQCHAYLQVIDGVPFIIDLGSRTGVVWYDGSQGRGRVYPEHVLRLGTFDVQILSPGMPGAAGASRDESSELEPGHDDFLPPVVLEVFAQGNKPGGHYPLERPISLIGRHPGCDVRLFDDAISYFHCSIVNAPDGAWCLDLLTRKGTLLNGRTTRFARLREGDLLEIGKVSLLVKMDSPTAQPLVVNGTAPSVPPGSAEAIIPLKLAESMSSAFVPFREMMEQFQQCFMTMAQMFTTMQHEHAATVYEQMRQMQELMREFRELRGENKQPALAPHLPAAPPVNQPVVESSAATPGPRLPVQRVVEGAEASALADAHAWFLDRLAKIGQQPANPKR